MNAGLLGEHPTMHELRAELARYANLDLPVLIEGESGSGKEIAACHHLHRQSQRHAEPLLVLNCSSINAALIEAMLFGHTRGAFTGAVREQHGYFGDAGRGTLFLDEIGELPIELQGKLLRVLENGEYQRLGETRTRHAQARIVAATHRDLQSDVRQGRFRADLYHRLSVFKVQIPPLRERGDDCLLLFEHFKSQLTTHSPSSPLQLDQQARQAWREYSFPGNVRELRNIVARLTARYAGTTIGLQQLQREFSENTVAKQPGPALTEADELSADQAYELALDVLGRKRQLDLNARLAFWEKSYVRAALEIANGNLSRAARQLGLHRTTLYNRMRTWEGR